MIAFQQTDGALAHVATDLPIEEVMSCPVCSGVLTPFHQFLFAQLPFRFKLRRCGVCGLAVNTPRLRPEESAQLYGGDYYVFDAETDHDYEASARRDLARIRPWVPAGARLLEIGCARGHLLALARDAGYEVRGVEISPEASNEARSRGLPVMTGTIETIGRCDLRFDAVVALDVIEHVHDPLEFLSCARKQMAFGSKLILETPNVDGLFARMGGRHWIGFNPYHIALFSQDALVRACQRSGFEIRDLVTVEGRLLSVDGLRRIGAGHLVPDRLRRTAGAWLRAHQAGASSANDARESVNGNEGSVARWINSRRMGDQLLVHAVAH